MTVERSSPISAREQKLRDAAQKLVNAVVAQDKAQRGGWWNYRHQDAVAAASMLVEAALPPACDGSKTCKAGRHTHGCHVDYGNCDSPDEHGDGAPFHGSHY